MRKVKYYYEWVMIFVYVLPALGILYLNELITKRR